MGNRDNRDRYGHRHRNDDAHDVGDPAPGTVGDSDGTIHDRARRNENVVVDGKVRSQESHARSSAEVTGNESTGTSSNSTSGGPSQAEVVGQVVEVEIDRYGGTRETLAVWKNHQIHIDGGTPGETIRVELAHGNGFLVGERVTVRE